jgi:hypothetical protein
MKIKYFPLGISENNRLIKAIRILFGVVCLGVAIFWTVFNISSLKTNGNLWVTIVFLSGFGFYQIWAGIGKATRFIEIGHDHLRMKKSSFLPPDTLYHGEIEKIEVFPMNLVFFLKTKKKIMVRFGTTFHDVNEKIKEEIISFADANSIPLEIIEEKI